MKIVIAGAGPAGATVAETLRERGDGADIVMVSREPYPPYSPPAMLEYFSTGREVHFWKGKDFTERLGLDYRPGTEVEAVNPSEKTVRLSNGETHLYDRLVLATGGRLYAPLEGETKPGVYRGQVTVSSKGQAVGSLDVELEVLPIEWSRQNRLPR